MKLYLTPIVILLVAAFTTGCKDRGVTEPAPPDTSGGPIERKPNLYLYPTSKQTISVTLEFPHGGRILDSDPPYGSGWTVEVDPNGRINGRYDYLYYEAQTEDRYQYSSGWVVQKDTLHQFFLEVLSQAGFSGRETGDFLDYWIPRLHASNFYAVYPQESEQIENLIKLAISPHPTSLLRLFFVIEALHQNTPALAQPGLIRIERQGFFVAEWGVVLKEHQ
jgi:hypothetical protein